MSNGVGENKGKRDDSKKRAMANGSNSNVRNSHNGKQANGKG